MPSEPFSTASKRAVSISPMRRAKKRLPNSPLDGCEEMSDGAARLAGRLPLPRGGCTDQQIDQSIDRISLRQIDAALEGGLDQATDNLRATDRLAVLQTDVDCQSIEIS